jgi:hypothetical protein
VSEYRTAASASVETSLDRKRARFRQCAATPAIVAWSASSCSERRDPATEACYRPPADGPLGRRSGCWYGRWLSSGQRLSAVVCCLSFVRPCVARGIGGKGDMPVEALFPQGRERFELGSSGWSRVLGIDAVGGPPHCDFANEGGA